MTTDLAEALLHAQYSESTFPQATGYSPIGVCGHSSTKIFDLQDHFVCLFVEANDRIETP